MGGFLAIIIVFALLVWLISSLIKTGDRLERLESEVGTLKKELQQRQLPPPVPAEPIVPTPAPAPAPEEDSPLPEPAPARETSPASSPKPPPLPRPPIPAPAQTPPLPPRVTRPAVVIPTVPAFDWRAFLQRIYLLPPSGANAEATIGAWWLTRIGLIVFIIAAVFFGIRIAQDVPPWVRVMTLGGIAAGVILLGTWLERRLTAFGRLISAGGLGLGYFTAFAAYGVEATKVIDNPAIGFFAQIAAVAAVVGFSLWKRDEVIGAMAPLLGYVACWFSLWHDLDHFMIAALLILAAGSGLLHWARHWRWPLLVATIGSWTGFLILGVFEWPAAGQAPGLPLILGSMALLMAILEATNFLAEERYREAADAHPAWRRWLAVINTSAGVAIGWLAIRLAYPRTTEVGELDAFFLVFAGLTALFAALRFWRKHPTGLTETYFLKASGLLALFVVESYDGPTRWLSLSVQTLILLWAWQRSRLKWIEAGFWILLGATLVVIAHDVLRLEPAAWTWINPRLLIGTLSLSLLSAGLALNARWSAEPADAGLKPDLDGMLADVSPKAVLRFFAALLIGATAVPLVMNPAPPAGEPAPLYWLTGIAMAIALPAAAWRRFPPVAAGLAALVPAFVIYLQIQSGEVEYSTPFLLVGVWLTLLGLGLAEIALRLWRDRWILGNGVRAILQGFGIVTLAATIRRFTEQPESPAQWLEFAMIAPFVIAGVWVLFRQSRMYPARHYSDFPATASLLQWLLAGVVGFSSLAILGGLDGVPAYAPSMVVLIGVGLFCAAFLTRHHTPALAGGIPLLAGVAAHMEYFHDSSPGGWPDHLRAALIILLACWGTALVLWKRTSSEKSSPLVAYDLILHALALLVLHWLYRTHLDIPTTFLADALTALGVIVVHRFAPFRALAPVSALPLGVALLHLVTGLSASADWGDRWLWWHVSVVILVWLWLGHQWFVKRDHATLQSSTRIALFGLHEGIAALALTIAGSQTLDNPWHLVTMSVFATGLAALGRLGRLPSSLWWSLVPLGAAILGSWTRLTGAVSTPSYEGLVAISLVAGMTLIHGILVTWGLSRKKRSLAWIHGLVLLLGLVFPAYAVDRFGVESLTTVCWGIASVILFSVGFAAALRPYRLTGLIGLGLSMLRMFLVDIDDPLYRIYAFFVIALVLLGMGYLYHRFRHLIERADRHIAGEEPPTAE